MNINSARTVLLVAFLLLFFLFAGCGPIGPAPLAAHRGVGKFEDLSGKAGPFIRGYSISLPVFDLSSPHEAEYELAELPNIQKECGVYLAILHDEGTPWLRETKDIDGELLLELVDAGGNAVVNVSGPLGDYIWAQGSRFELYQLDKSFFVPDPKQEYKLRVSYSPDPRLSGMRGFVYLRCGGSK
jgi:hypothetical protein